MNTSVSLAISNLIPRHSGALPPELVELASSLLAQSRSKCSNLKAEEEIGRTYACANIACERLKTTLNLPKIEPRPPLPPRVYARLYAYFDRSLVAGTPRKRTRHSTTANTTPIKSSLPAKRTPGRNATPIKSSVPVKGTPTKEKSLAGFRTPKKGLKYGKRDEGKLPRWVQPVVRGMCEKLRTGTAIPHVLAGVETVICMPPAEDRTVEGKWPAMMIAIWAFVRSRLLGAGYKTTQREFAEKREQALQALRELREDDVICEKVGGEEWEGWELDGDDEGGDNEKDVNDWMKQIHSQGWLDMDWYHNIVEGEGLEDEEEAAEQDHVLPAEEHSRIREDEMKYGIGTMRQKKVDYLTDKKRADYKMWRKSMLAKIQQMIEDGVQDANDVDVEMT